jgi:hypothetical protein
VAESGIDFPEVVESMWASPSAVRVDTPRFRASDDDRLLGCLPSPESGMSFPGPVRPSEPLSVAGISAFAPFAAAVNASGDFLEAIPGVPPSFLGAIEPEARSAGVVGLERRAWPVVPVSAGIFFLESLDARMPGAHAVSHAEHIMTEMAANQTDLGGTVSKPFEGADW